MHQPLSRGIAGLGFLTQGGVGKNELQELETLQDRPFNHIYWSPMGSICLLAAMGDDVGPHNGRLEVRHVCSSIRVPDLWDRSAPLFEACTRRPTHVNALLWASQQA